MTQVSHFSFTEELVLPSYVHALDPSSANGTLEILRHVLFLHGKFLSYVSQGRLWWGWSGICPGGQASVWRQAAERDARRSVV